MHDIPSEIVKCKKYIACDKFNFAFHNYTLCTKISTNAMINKGDRMLLLEDDLIAERIKHFRESANLTQEKLAELIGISRNQMSNIECGNNKLSYKTLRKLCDALDICPCELIRGTNHRTVLENTVDLIKHMDEEQQIIIHQMVLAFYETNVELKNKK